MALLLMWIIPKELLLEFVTKSVLIFIFIPLLKYIVFPYVRRARYSS